MNTANDPEKVLEGFLQVLKAIAHNATEQTLIHKEVRSIARAAVPVLVFLPLPQDVETEIAFLLEAMAAYGIPHRERSQCAARAVRLIQKVQHDRELEKRSPGYAEF
jgi:hypothetical protein